MSVIVGQNSWITIAECDTYLTDHLSSEDWFDLSDVAGPGAESKSTLLVSAFNWLMGAAQLNLSADLTDDSIKTAQAESALFLMEHYDELNSRRAAMFTGVEEFELSKRREVLNIHNLAIPSYIISLLDDYLNNNCTVDLEGHYDT